MMEFRFAAFIMTYERPNYVTKMIDALMRQTLPPSKILVVDNSISSETEQMFSRNVYEIEYIRVGYNSGPAGAAKIGLEKLAAQGYEWIYWGDDNDPPRFVDCFERLFATANSFGSASIGVIGAVGSRFDFWRARKIRIPDDQIMPVMEVDSVGGGLCMLVNAQVVKKGCLPDPRLFFGVEEFDFCMAAQRIGFKVVVDGTLFRQYRESSGRIGIHVKNRLVSGRTVNTLWREYYSMRNLLFVYIYKMRSPWLMSVQMTKIVGKSLFGFVKGVKFGCMNFSLMWRALLDGTLGRLGATVSPVRKP
jgi:GT2 family glycosyltransferase